MNSSTSNIKALLVDNNENEYLLTKALLKISYNDAFELDWSNSYDKALELILSNEYNICLMDYKLGEHTGVDLLHEIMANEVNIPVIMLTNEKNREIDIAAMQAGAADYLIKGAISPEILERSIRYAIERKESEDIRRKLEDKIATHEKIMSVGCLAIGMAHEINNPLAGILQSIQNVMRRIDPEREKNRAIAETCNIDLNDLNSYMTKHCICDFLERITISGERISSIVSTILQFSGHNKSHFERANICTIIETAVAESRQKLGLSENFGADYLNVILDLDPELTEINCIDIEIQDVISIVVDNALLAMTEDRCNRVFTPESISEVPLRERCLDQYEYTASDFHDFELTIRTRKECNTACIEIEDNGPGMTSEIARRVFEPFFTTTRTGKTGLGLAIAYFIVTNTHSGTIDLKSEEGVGTKFTIKLPIGL